MKNNEIKAEREYMLETIKIMVVNFDYEVLKDVYNDILNYNRINVRKKNN